MSDADNAWQEWTLHQLRYNLDDTKPAFMAGYRRAGDDLLPLLRVGPLFWQKVDVRRSTSECWEWQGSRIALDYGQARFVGLPATTAHRLAWALTNGRIPDADEVVRHVCDNPPCCNPNHLLIGSQLDNVADMVERGRAEHQRPTCRNGHPRTPENTKYDRNGSRRCVECERINRERWDRSWTCDGCGAVLAQESHKHRHFKSKRHRASSVGTKDGASDHE